MSDKHKGDVKIGRKSKQIKFRDCKKKIMQLTKSTINVVFSRAKRITYDN